MSDCPCGSSRDFSDCCEPIITGAAKAPTPEALMRSRYSAFATGNIDWLQQSLSPDTRDDFEPAHTEDWSRNSDWTGLEVRSTSGGGPMDAEGWVEFVARFEREGEPHMHHETSRFVKVDDAWYYQEGHMGQPQRRVEKVGRNDPCPCGSGKKYKKCCGA